MSDRRRLLALHEAAHTVFVSLFGWLPRWVTIESGSAVGGCTQFSAAPVRPSVLDGINGSEPFPLLPPDVRDRFERSVMISLAGQLAEEMLTPTTRRLPEPVSGQVAEILRQPPEPEVAAEAVAAVNDESMPSDAEHVARTARAAFGRDVVLAADWVWWLERQARSLIVSHADQILRLAGLLEIHGTLDGQQIAASLNDETLE